MSNDYMEHGDHSRLLKFLLPTAQTNKMAEPEVHELKIEYINPSDIESEVPGKQELREGDVNAVVIDNSTLDDDIIVETPVDYVLSPVITVTKEESTYTKGDLKLQKVSVNENISNNEVNGKHDETNADATKTAAQTLTPGTERETYNDNKGRSRIPTSQFRQALEKFKNINQDANEKKNDAIPTPSKRSSFLKPKEVKITTPPNTPAPAFDEGHEVEDEFDKIYDEVIHHEPKQVTDNTSDNIKDSVQLEDEFEEIIHDYEDNKVQPIDINKVKQSRIPQISKRGDDDNKLQTNNIPAQMVIEKSKINDAKIDSKIPINRNLLQKQVRDDVIISNTDNKGPVTREIPQKPPRIRYSSKDDEKQSNNNKPNNTVDAHTENETTAETLAPEDTNINNNSTGIKSSEQSNIKLTEAEPVKVATQEDIDRITKDNIEKRQNDITLKIEEIVETPLVMEVNAIIDIKPESVDIEDNQSATENIKPAEDKGDNSVKLEANVENDKEGDDSNYTPGKVSKILSRLRSFDKIDDTKQSNNVNVKETPKRKSVLSKIAMFERPDVKAPPNPRLIQNGIPTRKPLETKTDFISHESVYVKPIIVDEVLKASIQRDLHSNIIEVKTETNSEAINSKNKGEIVEETIKYQKIEVVDAKVSQPIAESIDQPLVLDNSIQLVENATENLQDISQPKEIHIETIHKDIITEPNNTIENEPILVENTVEILEPIKTEYSEPLPINIEEKKLEININDNNIVIDELVLEPVENKRTEYENNVEISNSDDDSVFYRTEDPNQTETVRRDSKSIEEYSRERPKSVAELDLGESVKGKVHEMITKIRMNSFETGEVQKKEKEIEVHERPRKKSVSMMIALFEQKTTKVQYGSNHPNIERIHTKPTVTVQTVSLTDEEYDQRTAELTSAKLQYGRAMNMTYLILRNGVEMPVLALGTALMDKRLIRHIIGAAIDLGFRAIDTAYIYGNEAEVGEAIKAKIDDGTVTREELFITSKLWSTYHRPDLVEVACRASLTAMQLDYFDLYLIHNPMSFKEGKAPIPKIANVIQYSEYDYLDAWYGMEELVGKDLVKSIGVSNFNSIQLTRILGRAKLKPVINQVECHPYLSQERLHEFCEQRDVKLTCYGVLGSKGTPKEYRSGLQPIVDDPLVKVMAAGLNMTIAQLLLRYQIDLGRSVVVKASTGAHLWDNLQALERSLIPEQVEALNALNKNKRTYTFAGMGETHRNYPFNIPF
ncbi:probable serine/threonine-protein kinase kinX [Achroia grisella]|uniref:probable serine/threonine-protein kinase kinX n=1 Tax=Achroia grisella TaxID=688607 RepID=UPI0027D2A9AC|nr:probable serine/threonine-protein kinase kinX [Achroia grisella]